MFGLYAHVSCEELVLAQQRLVSIQLLLQKGNVFKRFCIVALNAAVFAGANTR